MKCYNPAGEREPATGVSGVLREQVIKKHRFLHIEREGWVGRGPGDHKIQLLPGLLKKLKSPSTDSLSLRSPELDPRSLDSAYCFPTKPKKHLLSSIPYISHTGDMKMEPTLIMWVNMTLDRLLPRILYRQSVYHPSIHSFIIHPLSAKNTYYVE